MTDSVHRRTPSLTVSDGRGLPVRQIAYLRSVAGETATTLITRQQHDATGRLVAQWDPRLSRPNLATVYGLTGNPLKVASVDAGWRLSLPGLTGETLQRRDARGNHWRTTYDDQLRVVSVEENALPDIETFTYADASADAGHNLRGRLFEQVDPSGTLRLASYGLLGQPLRETRTFDDAKAFVSRHTYSPLGAVLEQIDAGDHRQQSRYDRAGQLKQVQLRLKGQIDWQPVLQDAQYNATGQIIEQQAGNGVISRWIYDPADARLQRQCSQKNQQPALLDSEYVYDPMGNITRILDHVFTPSHFANQRVDGHREFSYDSLYRLHSASGYDDGPPSDIPGLPQPTDPNNRLNYTQTYTYDHGGNLIKLCHVRDGACHTREMFIDPASNRGVRWTPGAPAPEFDKLFDHHGNLQALQPGQAMQWNARDQLESVTLIHRDNGPNDKEYYRYSQGIRVYKHHDTHAATTRHFHEVRYLPGLEIRTRDNGEELHVIILAAGFGNVRCLHWEKDPANIGTDQLRYTLDDHLGSCAMELDQQAQLISHEGYYPFGATAWMAAHSAVEVSYKTVRYSGKEMDVSGLYYYGTRYLAVWLMRWISADPAGAVDGLNLYGFVGNNPLGHVDPDGGAKAPNVILNYSSFISLLGGYAEQTLEQLDNVIYQKNIAKELGKNLVGETISGVIGYEGGVLGSAQAGTFLPTFHHYAAFKPQTAVPYLEGLTGGNVGGDLAGGASAPFTNTSGLIRPLIPQTSTMSVAAMDAQLSLAKNETVNWAELPGEVLNPGFLMNRVIGSVISITGGALNMGSRVQEAEDIKNRLDPVKINKIETMLSEWKAAVEERWANAEVAFNALRTDVIYPADVLPNVNFMTSKETLAPIHRSALQQQTRTTLDYIDRAQKGMAYYKERGTTDNQYLLKQAHIATRKASGR
jgi:insecticidal toxin complex protein TccC